MIYCPVMGEYQGGVDPPIEDRIGAALKYKITRRKAIGGGIVGVGGTIAAIAATFIHQPSQAVAGGGEAYKLFFTKIEKDSGFGKGEAKIGLAYPDKTDLNDHEIASRVAEDIKFIESIVSLLPVVGYPIIAVSAQDRYKYDFKAVNRDSLGTYNKGINQLFLNMEGGPSLLSEHLIPHELGGHYLSMDNSESLKAYIDSDTLTRATSAQTQLITSSARYTQSPAMDAEVRLWEAFESKTPVTWEQIVNAANVYPAEIWQHPERYLQFKDKVDLNEVKKRCDEELYAEITSFVLTAQRLGLFDASYKHPVLGLLQSIKR